MDNVQADHVQLQKCPNCEAPLRYDPESGKMVCDYCDSTFELEPEPDPAAIDANQSDGQSDGQSEEQKEQESDKKNNIKGFDFDSLLHQAEAEDCTALPVYICHACGAEIIADSESFSLTCPFCKNNVVLSDKITGKLRPDAIIPFKITPDNLPAEVRKYYKKERTLPRKFFSENVMGKITGIYVPFWVFSGSVDGEISYKGEIKGKEYRVGDYLMQDYKEYRLDRHVSLSFKDIPVDASEKMDDALMDSIEPFDMSEAKAFDIRYLAGYSADRFDVPAANIAKRAKGRMCNTVSSMAVIPATTGYSTATVIGSNLDVDWKVQYVLMPVYQFDLEYNSKKYTFAVNGQTGKVIGNLPEDNVRAWFFSILDFLIPAAAIFAIPIIKYLMGG